MSTISIHGFEWRASLRIYFWVIGEDGEIGGVAFGNHAVGYIGNGTAYGEGSETVHCGFVGFFHGSMAVESIDMSVSHAVGDENKVFHDYDSVNLPGNIGGAEMIYLFIV